METFSVGAMVRFGWETFKKRPWFFIGVFFIISILSSGYSYEVSDSTKFTPDVVGLLFVAGIVMAVVNILVNMGKTKLLLKAHDDVGTVALSDLWAPHPFWRFVGGCLLLGLVVLVGLILLIIPGVIWGLRYMFTPYIVMDRGLRPLEAFRESGRITKGHLMKLALLSLAFLGINIIGFLCLVVGLLVSIPVTSLAFVHVYRTLSRMAPAQSA